MRRRLITAGLLLGGLVLAACGTSGPGIEARQTGDTTTTTTTAPETTTTTAAPSTTTATTAAPPPTVAVELPCTPEALESAYTAAYRELGGAVLKVQKCVGGWATSAQTKGFDPPVFTLYRAEGDHWVAVNRSGGKLCEGHGVPPDIAPQIGCDT